MNKNGVHKWTLLLVTGQVETSFKRFNVITEKKSIKYVFWHKN